LGNQKRRATVGTIPITVEVLGAQIGGGGIGKAPWKCQHEKQRGGVGAWFPKTNKKNQGENTKRRP